ncbi:MAG: type II CRISPR RNA-guided endonuclease Cas9 [Methanomassiliicoccaceae archaeon]|nr:type II CRISPR RNA-guided endonuclease Cas9 [Methanomassiliicoccaceae archaeon]
MEKYGSYYLGLDVGTNSVGWAVTDENYNILQFRKRAMWGIHLFDEGKTAKKRRLHRTARRRLERRRKRIKLLRELFDSEISKVDMGFYARLDESWKHLKDRNTKHKSTLFNDPNKDKDFHKKYPTIYHLRSYLMSAKEPDIRLVYLAAHHIIKYRGHFLFKGLSDEDIPEFGKLFKELLEVANEECDFGLSADNICGKLKEILLDANLGIRERGKEMQELLGAEERGEKELLTLIAGGKADMDKLFGDKIDLKFSFGDSDYEDSFDGYANALGPDRAYIVELCKSVYDWSVLKKILKKHDTISEVKVEDYYKHKKDLEVLKQAVKEYVPGKYDEIFKSEKTENNYCTYVKEYGNRIPEKKSCTQEDFCKYIIKEVLNNIPKDAISGNPSLEGMQERLNNSTFLPKQTIKSNSVIPYTLHRKELKKILDNASKYYPFLSDVDGNGLSVRDKILMINEFKIPYYVGPLNEQAKAQWAVRKSEGEITPWDFENIVDLDGSAVKFIDRLTSTCRYIRGEKVLPKNSLIYSRFELLNELNNVKINKSKIDPELKRKIEKDLFENVDSVKKVKLEDIRKHLKKEGLITDECEITGIDDSIKSNLRSFVQMKKIIGDKVSDREMVENIIQTVTTLGNERSRAYKILKDDHGDKLTDAELKSLSELRFKGWGRLSKKLLIGLYHHENTGLSGNIMTYLEQTQDNFMQILNKYSFAK